MNFKKLSEKSLFYCNSYISATTLSVLLDVYSHIRFRRLSSSRTKCTNFVTKRTSQTVSTRGVSLIEGIIYVAIFMIVFLVVVQLIVNTQNAFVKARYRRAVHEQGTAALDRIIREIRLAKSVDASQSSMDVNPGTLVLNTVVSDTDATPIIRKFFIQNSAIMLQEGVSSAVPMTSNIRVTNFVFHDAGKTKASNQAYYVRGSYAGCSNTKDGLTPPTAFCTISKAATLADAGGTVLVGAGTYNETVILTKSGTVDEPIAYIADVGGTYTGDPGEVIVDGVTNGFQLTSTGSGTGIDYTTIEGFTIRGSTAGIWAGQGSDYDVIRNNKIIGNTNGIFLTTSWGNGGFTHAVGWLIEFNDIYNNTNGVNFNDGFFTNAVVQYNKIHANVDGILATDRGNGSFEPAENVTLQHNEIYSNSGIGVHGHPWFDGIFFDNHIYNNTAEGFWVPFRSYGFPQLMTFRNNSIHNNGADGLLFGNESNRSSLNASSIIENNIITKNGGNGIDTTLNQCAVIRNNDVWLNTAPNYNGCPNQTGLSGNISQDPLFVSVNDVHLQAVATGHAADSPGIDHGYQSVQAAALDERSTRTDGVVDTGTVDMGYHYADTSPGIQQFFAGDPVSQAIQVEVTAETSAGKFYTVETLEGTAVIRGSYR